MSWDVWEKNGCFGSDHCLWTHTCKNDIVKQCFWDAMGIAPVTQGGYDIESKAHGSPDLCIGIYPCSCGHLCVVVGQSLLTSTIISHDELMTHQQVSQYTKHDSLFINKIQ